MQAKTIISILTSVDQVEKAQWMAQQLLDLRLAACIQQTSGTSYYMWQGKREQAQEYYLHIKTTPDCQQGVLDWLAKHHSYDVPEIIVLEGLCSRAYGQWMKSSLLQEM